MFTCGRERDTDGSFWAGFVTGALAGAAVALLMCSDKRRTLGAKIRTLRAKACCCGEGENVSAEGSGSPSVEEQHCAHGLPNTEER